MMVFTVLGLVMMKCRCHVAYDSKRTKQGKWWGFPGERHGCQAHKVVVAASIIEVAVRQRGKGVALRNLAGAHDRPGPGRRPPHQPSPLPLPPISIHGMPAIFGLMCRRAGAPPPHPTVT
uniref:Secreted protein n=1 Tax=Setaria viridis TaxID=4556 RepID=A0A4U6U8K2_SETVI|nr:hypothetical protein SEVIR_6G199000v2 [Setaria viridis]